MTAIQILEKMSMELLLTKSASSATFEPFLKQLKAEAHDAIGTQFISRIEILFENKKNLSPLLRVERILNEIDAFADFLDKHASAKLVSDETTTHTPVEETSGLLSYDATHGKEILDSFFSEVAGHLQAIEQNIIHLESNPADKHALNAVFGAMHSLKGIMGFLNVRIAGQIAHEAEAVMEAARKRTSGISRAECDAVIRAVDLLREIESRILAHSKNSDSPYPQLPPSCAQVLGLLKDLPRALEKCELRAVTPATEPAPVVQAPAELQDVSASEPTRVLDRSGFVRVKVEKLDSLMEAIGELVVVQSQVNQDSELQQFASQRISRNLSQLNKITRDLQSVAMSLRMHPLRDLFNRMTRLARDTAQRLNKEIEVVVEGNDTELDKNVIESLVDPMTHLVRNSIDHGIENVEARTAAGKPARGRLSISARHQSGSVLISITDDGLGLNYEKIAKRARERGIAGPAEEITEARLRHLIFEPGFSTAERVTDLSGRGVGLDVVRKNVQALGGRVSVESVPGHSTTFLLTVPLTLAIIDGLIVRTGSERYIVPITSVIESVRPARQHISTVQERGEIINVRGTFLPLIRLSEFSGIKPIFSDPTKAIAIIIECGGERCALLVDDLIGQQQVVIRNLGECLQNIRGVASGAILGDGRVGLILDVPQILQARREMHHAATA